MNNTPFHATEKDYQHCCNLIVEEARKNESVTSVYLLGGTWCPGISDIDIVIVYKDEQKPMRSPWSLSQQAGKIFTHRYLSFHRDDFPLFYYLYPQITTNLRLLWGEDIHLNNPEEVLSESDYKDLLVFNFTDVLVHKLLPFSFRLRYWREDIRRHIGELYSLVYTITMVEEITGERIGGDYANKINDLREHWFERSLDENEKLLAHLQKMALNIVFDSLECVSRFLPAYEKEAQLFVNRAFTIVAEEHWSREHFLNLSERSHVSFTTPFSHKRVENFYLMLPSPYFSVITSYAEGSGPLSALMKYAIKPKPQDAFRERSGGVLLHIQALNALFDRLIKSDGFYRVPFTFGFSLIDIKKPYIKGIIVFIVRILRTYAHR